jgi:alcohol dehydrogenase (cytochrome c)
MTSPVRVGGVAVAFVLGTMIAAAQVQIKAFRPVTDEMLRNPGPSDWINWRRTLDGWGYSPLDQITRHNVAQLQLVWSWGTQPGANELAPLVYNGVMYLPSPGGIEALDAATGDFIWEYRREPAVARRNIAICKIVYT